MPLTERLQSLRRAIALAGVVALPLVTLPALATLQARRAEAALDRPADAERRALDLAFFRRRVAADPAGAADRAQLAGLYLQAARESGRLADYRRAEQAARASLEIRGFRNGKAQLVLASSLLAQHRFAEARAAAETLLELDSTMVGHRALLGEIQLELGDYEAARGSFGAIAGAWRNLAVAPRLARWAEMEGRMSEARYILDRALAEASRRTDLPREQAAWFHLRVADLALRTGRLDHAGTVLGRGLRAAPDDPRLLAARARLEAARGRWRGAIRWGERALAGGADIATLALVGDAWGALGDTSRAASFWARAEAAGRDNPEPFNRQWTLFLLDHDRQLGATRDLLEGEITERQDVYGWDQLAWARHQTGDRAGAREAMAQARRMGTRDAALSYHAALIALADADTAGGCRNLREALTLNPAFHHLHATGARALLDRLSTGRAGRAACPPDPPPG
jgi:tetratricopeptide (TPR) repeat protein